MRHSINMLKRTAALLALAVAACLLAGLAESRAAQVPATKEYQIKAAFLFNFTKFIEWPAGCFADSNSPIVIGVIGKDPFGSELQDAVQGRKINGRSIVLKTIESIEQARAVHLLFIPSTEESQAALVLKGLGTSSVLTVGESEQFVSNDGIIHFVLEGDKVRFEINANSADRARLKISAQLQKLARPAPRKP